MPNALITGAAKRIGACLARGLANDGWGVAVHYSNSETEAQGLVAEITDAGGRAVALGGELADATQVARLVPAAGDALGTLDLLVNNAARFERDTLATLTAESWDAHLDINLRAPALLARDFVAQYPNDRGGNIVNVIDQRVWRLTPDFTSYTVSKSGLWALTQTLAQALAPKVRVNALGPGPTLPNPRQTQAHFDRQASLVPMGAGATPDDVLAGLRYILSAEAMTGQMLALDGGQHLAWQTPDITQVQE